MSLKARLLSSATRKSNNLFILLRMPCLLVIIFQCLQMTIAGSDNQAMFYLSRYGYLPPAATNPTSGNLLSEDTFSSAIREFQSFAGINITGELDSETLELMEAPRCGVKDKVGSGSSRSRRYALQGSRWRVKDLTYKISKYPKKLSMGKTDTEVKRAFAVWSEYTDLTFTQKKTGSVHIEIRFESGEHGDGDPFDGPGGTLAHAYFPVYGGDAHFDDEEVWTVDTHRGTNLFQVAAHEFGHSLGLSHSDVRSALMAPFYRGYQPYFSLDEDDIQGIQILYGKKSGTSRTTLPSKATTEPTNTNTIGSDSELCKNGAVDTIFNDMNEKGVKETYVFKGDKFWKLEDEGIAPGYPQLIKTRWPGLPGNIDAAFSYKNGKTYFFKGSKYWRYFQSNLDGDYPKDISEGFKGIPNNIDAAFVWSGNGKIYFLKGDKFWRFDPSSKPPVRESYPKPISNWEGIPANVDAALQYTNGYTYFFKKGAYWRFNDRNFKVDEASPAFPRSASFWWYGCKDGTKGTLGNRSGQYSSTTDDGYGLEGVSSEQNEDHRQSVDDLILDAATTEARTLTSPSQDSEGLAGKSSGTSSSMSIACLLSGLLTLAIRYL